MLVIVVAGIVVVELLVLVVGISVPESRLQAVQILKFEELHRNIFVSFSMISIIGNKVAK